jgi:anti-sigma regulatory factor (Ser/Thr protein kinase)
MGNRALPILGIPKMNLGPMLAQPIRAEIGPEGHLLLADEPVRRLHLLAGGVDGGRIAVPALADLVSLTRRIKMRLARAVRVADDNQDIELWVETALKGDIVLLSILGWRGYAAQSNFDENSALREEGFELSEGIFSLHFDQGLKLIATRGALPANFSRQNFGKQIFDIFDLTTDQNTHLRSIITARQTVGGLSISLIEDSQPYKLHAKPALSKKGIFTGYAFDLAPQPASILSEAIAITPAILFNQQLAPVLRQPLGRIIANAETIGGKLQGPIRENYAVYAKDIADAARHLMALVDDLGDLEAVERPDFSTAKDSIELGDVARRVAGLLALKAADHQITILVPSSDRRVAATAEFRRVLQILLNLITNAIRYSPDGTQVSIEITEIEDRAAISVIDQGAGIDISDQEKIFEKFERLGRTGDGGSGLGLYISRRLARFMGGDLTVEASEQSGAKFTLLLPKN